MEPIFGRERELKTLQQVITSQEAEFVAVYGRRRVGKTFLIREFFSAQPGVYFEFTGMKDASLASQLSRFVIQLNRTFPDWTPERQPKNWSDAFELLSSIIEEQAQQQSVFVFLDELPWMATARSGLLPALDHFWNTRWSQIPTIKLIVCGSAASWMLEKLIHNKGGLYNRLTRRLQLSPFRLSEVRQFLQGRKIKLSLKQVLDIYMVMGGIPHYLKQIERGRTAAENIDHICFQNDGLLHDEFSHLFQSLFDQSEQHEQVIRLIAEHRYGLSREELLQKMGVSSGGGINKKLKELEAAGFIQKIVPYQRKKKDYYFRVIDEYTLFYLKWIQPQLQSRPASSQSKVWQSLQNSPSWKSWSGYAFEGICWKHVDEIQKALGIEHIPSTIGQWRYLPPKNKSSAMGAQIDLLFDREDGAVSLCEIKHNQTPFVIDKAYAQQLFNKQQLFQESSISNQSLFWVMITSGGLKSNLWSKELIDAEISLDALMTPL